MLLAHLRSILCVAKDCVLWSRTANALDQAHALIFVDVVSSLHRASFLSLIPHVLLLKHAAILSTLAAKARSVVRQLDERHSLNFMSLKTTGGEIMVALDPHDQYILVVLQTLKSKPLEFRA